MAAAGATAAAEVGGSDAAAATAAAAADVSDAAAAATIRRVAIVLLRLYLDSLLMVSRPHMSLKCCTVCSIRCLHFGDIRRA